MYDASIKSFVVQNGLIIAIAGITIGTSTKDVIQAFSIYIMMPLFHKLIIEGLIKKWSNKYYRICTRIFGESKRFLWTVFLKEVMTWCFIVVIAYILIQFFLKKIFENKTVEDEKIVQENQKFFKFQKPFLFSQ